MEPMANLDLDKIIFKKQTGDIQCIYCGSDLEKNLHPNLIGKIVSFLSFGKIKPGHYQCENCQKKYTVL